MSTDAFAAALGRGAVRQPSWSAAARAGAVFGAVEAITPVAGWALGMIAAGFITAVDHWIAFVLLSLVGGRMIWSATHPGRTPEAGRAHGGGLALVATAIGTSIDAAAVGVGLAFIDVSIWLVAACIGLTTFAFTTFGMRIGSRIGSKYGSWAEMAGGCLLVGIGGFILFEHLSR